MKQVNKFLLLIMVVIALTLSACSGSSSSGNSDNNTADIAGVYTGNETLELIQNSDSQTVDSTDNEVRITIDGRGNLAYSAANGTSGSTLINKRHEFELRGDARTQFEGQCSSGVIILTGKVNGRKITGQYRSENLSCNNAPHTLKGNFTANR